MRTVRTWLALVCSVALVVALAIGSTVAQVVPVDVLDTDTFVDASGGDGGSARGGDGGRGGSGFAPVCNQSTDDLFAAEDEPKVSCGAGGAGGGAGDGGESIGGDGGIAFTVGGPPRPTTPTSTPTVPDVRQLLADVLIAAIRTGSFDIDVRNDGPDPASGVKLVVVLQGERPSSFDFVGTEHGTCTGPEQGTDISSPVTITCELGDLAVGEVATVIIDWVNENECPGTATVNATVSSASPPDPNLTNNTFPEVSETKGPFCG